MTHHLVGVAEVARMLGLTRQRIHQLKRDPDGFPQPTVRLATGPVWERSAIEEWAERTGRTLRQD